jgi:hypothetical protein
MDVYSNMQYGNARLFRAPLLLLAGPREHIGCLLNCHLARSLGRASIRQWAPWNENDSLQVLPLHLPRLLVLAKCGLAFNNIAAWKKH